MFCFIEFLRAIATMLIANSHFKGVYPNDILSFGGGLGLALFYMISGYLLVNIDDRSRFATWYGKKIICLFVPLYIVRIIELAFNKITVRSFGQFVKLFIFPGSWFGGSMLILYIIYYVFVKYCYRKSRKNALMSFLIFLFSGYVILFLSSSPIAFFSLEDLTIHEFGIETPYVISQFIWLQCMILGIYLRNHLCIKKGLSQMANLALAFFNILLFMIIKLIIINGTHHSIEILLGVSYTGFAFFLFRCFMASEDLCKKIGKHLPGKAIYLISACSLEIYYVQFLWIHALKDMIFPLNLIALVITITVTAYIVHRLSNCVIEKIMKKSFS